MGLARWLLLAGLIACMVEPCMAVAEELPHDAWADSTLAALRNRTERSPESTISTTDLLLEVYAREGNACGTAEVYGLRSTSFTDLGALDSAMACAHRTITGFGPGCDSLVYIRGLVAMSYLFLKLSEFDRADSICQAGLGLWNPAWRPTVLRNALLTNRAIAAARRGDLPLAEAGFRAIWALAEAEGEQQDMYDAMQNLGAIKNFQGQLDSAEHYYRASLANALAMRKVSRIAHVHTNLANVATERGEHRKANELLHVALLYADSAKDLSLRTKVQGILAANYVRLGDYEQAYRASVLRYELNDSLLNAKKMRSIAEMQAKYDYVKLNNELNTLRAESLVKELEESQARRGRVMMQFVALAVLGVAIGLFSRLRYINRARIAVGKEKAVSEQLLHNILPVKVADEIRAKGFADVREYANATILFTDFRDFTVLAGHMPAPALVAEIDHCYKAFDRIVEVHDVEKIKTIGDAYMAAGGLPDPQKGSPLQTVMAALDMNDFMIAYQAQRMAEDKPFFVMRIGLHTGPVVAGIVGVKKYAYDI